MARKRAIQQALQSGSDLIGQILRAQMQEQAQRREIQLRDSLNREAEIRQQQQAKELADYQSGLRRTEGDLTAQRARETNKLQFGLRRDEFLGQHPEARQPGGMTAKATFGQIQGANQPAEVPTPSAITGQMRLEGQEDPMFKGPFPVMMGREQVAFPVQRGERTPIEDLLRAASGRQGQLQAAQTAAQNREEDLKPRIGPGGVSGFQGRGGFVPTERTTADEAARQGTITGSEASNRTTSTLNAEFANLDKLRAIEEAKRKGAKAGEGGGTEGSVDTAAIDSYAAEMVKLSNELNTLDDGMDAMVQGLTQTAQGKTGYNPKAGRLLDLREGTTSMFLRRLGRVGTPTEADEARTRKILPDLGLTRQENVMRNQGFMKLMKGADVLQRVLGDIPSTLSPEAQSLQVQERLKIIQEYAETGVMNIPPHMLGGGGR